MQLYLVSSTQNHQNHNIPDLKNSFSEENDVFAIPLS